jgi:hypothetical protein
MTMKRTAFTGHWRGAWSKRSSALLITLFVLSLMAIIVVAFLGTMTWEMQASARNYENQQARAVVNLGLHTGIAKLRYAFLQWDLPYGKLYTNGTLIPFQQAGQTKPPTNFYSISPGAVTLWSYTSVNAITNYPLFSQPTDTTTLTVNLNAAEEDGSYPILGTSTPLNVYWSDVLANPRFAAAQTNQIIGRYAFWIDDENAKININTADGTLNTNLPPSQVGLGWGTPTAVSLQELQSGGAPISLTTASNIVAFARTTGFTTPKEILRIPGTTLDTYNNNTFNLTTMSRSPDLNIFGQPKMALIPANLANNIYYPSANLAYNLSTLQPLTEIFPGQMILSTLTMSGAYTGTVNSTTGAPFIYTTPAAWYWPVAFSMPEVDSFQDLPDASSMNGSWNNGWLITRYLSGKDAFGKAITWPVFPAAGGNVTTATSYLGKYTARQLDSIAAQIIDVTTKDNSADTGGPGGSFNRSSQLAMRGWLSGSMVNGLGRSPKLDKVMMVLTAQSATPSSGTGTATIKFVPPSVRAQLYMEMWMPSGFQGVSLFHNSEVYNSYYLGTSQRTYVVNCQDMGAYYGYLVTGSGTITTNNFTVTPAPLPRRGANMDTPSYSSTFIPPGNSTSYSYWGDNLLQTAVSSTVQASPVIDPGTLANLTSYASGYTNRGAVDWAGNNQSFPEADQVEAATYHPWAQFANGTTYSGKYYGTGISSGTLQPAAPIFQMTSIIKGNNAYPLINDWAPGQYRTVGNNATLASYFTPMSTNAFGLGAGTLYVFGGVQLLSETSGNRVSETGAVPLDAMRGSAWIGGSAPSNLLNTGSLTVESRTDEPFASSTTPTLFPAYTNCLQAVIPINAAVPVPAASATPTYGNPVYVYNSVPDPLVNNFPGDWTNNVVSFSDPTTAPFSTYYGSAGTTNAPGSTIYPNVSGDYSICAIYPETSTSDGAMQDPASYWLPSIDCNAYTNVAPGLSASFEAPQIPRTARFPSAGYLQYIRTGLMPDNDENSSPSVPYAQQHGTPFRLLNFNASTDSSQSVHSITYPDWAMLDLFYVPSTLLSPGSPYEKFAGTNSVYLPNGINYSTNSVSYSPRPVYSNTNAVNNMLQFGTYGGATSGRINPNGAVVYTTNANIPTPGITRTVPLQALLHGIQINPTVTGAAMYGNDYWAQTYSAITNVDEVAVANSIVNYLQTNTYGPGGNGPAPLRMPAEICNIPAVAAAVAPINPAHTRNDLVRQIVGNLTTQSNTFSIWVAAQSLQKSKANSGYGVYESGDQITASIRYHFVIERDLDPGIDGIYGNAANPGPDGYIGTLDDPQAGAPLDNGSSAYNWPYPSYTYHIIYAEEVR